MPRYCIPANLYINAKDMDDLWGKLDYHATVVDGDEQVTEYGFEFAPKDAGIVWVKDDEEIEIVN